MKKNFEPLYENRGGTYHEEKDILFPISAQTPIAEITAMKQSN